LALGAVQRVGGDDASRVHNGRSEERRILVHVVAAKQRHLIEDGDGPGRLAEDGHLGRVTTKGGNVVGDPLEREALVES